MAGFYGRVTNGLPAPITLDKIYSNRVNMRDNANTDGIWPGRYVLVSYYEIDRIELEENPNYYQNTTIDTGGHVVYEEAEVYNKNYWKDKSNGYPRLGNGYDATIWRKVVDREGYHTYVLLANLNAIVPTFNLVVEPPANGPAPPYFGVEDSTNVYYSLHMAANWGFRIAEATENQPSDVWITNNVEYSINEDDGKPILIPQTPYLGAIYFNKAGFSSAKTSKVTNIDNSITVIPAESGTTYNGVEGILDTQELSIILPSLGNAVSDMYDLMYGASTETPGGYRYTNTTWEDANARNQENRVSSRGLTYYKSSQGENRSGFAPLEAYSMAGTINSVHDMLGMIITSSTRPVDANDAYADQIYYDEVANTYYCVTETTQYQDPIEFVTADFSLTPAAFKTKFKDSETSYPSTADNKPRLTKYTGGQYIKTDDTPTYVLADAPTTTYGGAKAGATYYDLPQTLTYAGRMVTSKGNSYYSATGGTSGKDVVPDENGSWVIQTQDDMVLYHILPNTERFHSGTEYWVLNDDQTEYVPVTSVNSSNFENYVAAGLYRNGEMAVLTINPTSTRFKVHYINVNGQNVLQDLQGLNGGDYASALTSEAAFISFLTTQLGALSDVSVIDYDYLYIDQGLEPSGTGGYITSYRPYPVSKFLFANIDGSYYDNVYNKSVDGKSFTRITTQSLARDNVSETTIYRLSLSQETLFTGGWCIQVPANELDELRRARRNNLLTTIDTEDYTIYSIYWNDYFNPDSIYWTIDGDEAAFTVAGYGISTTTTPEDDANEASGLPIYYAPNVLYYKDEFDEFILADDKYVYTGSETLYRLNELIIVNRGDLDDLRNYSRWNNNLIQTTEDISYFFKPIASGGHGVQIAHKYIGHEWKELPGFARNLNTIHGWIIRLNNLFNTSDGKSRDLNTYQGCINTLKDILAKFSALTPGTLLQVNKHGQIESGSAITYTPRISNGSGGYTNASTTSTMTLEAALAKISELELRIAALES